MNFPVVPLQARPGARMEWWPFPTLPLGRPSWFDRRRRPLGQHLADGRGSSPRTGLAFALSAVVGAENLLPGRSAVTTIFVGRAESPGIGPRLRSPANQSGHDPSSRSVPTANGTISLRMPMFLPGTRWPTNLLIVRTGIFPDLSTRDLAMPFLPRSLHPPPRLPLLSPPRPRPT